MYRIGIVLLLWISILTDSFAQVGEVELKHHLGFKIGWMGVRFRDRVIGTSLYKGGAVPIKFDYGFSSENFRSSSSVIFNANDSVNSNAGMLKGFSYQGENNTFVQDTIGYLTHQAVQVNYLNFNFDLLRRLNIIKNAHWKLFLGGGLNFTSINKKFLTLFYTNQLNDRYYNLQVVGRVEYSSSSKHYFNYQLALPLVNYVSRVLYLEYAAQDQDSFKKWSFYNNYFSFNSSLVYQFRFARHWSIEGVYQFNYLQCALPRKEQLVAQALLAGLNFHF